MCLSIVYYACGSYTYTGRICNSEPCDAVFEDLAALEAWQKANPDAIGIKPGYEKSCPTLELRLCPQCEVIGVPNPAFHFEPLVRF